MIHFYQPFYSGTIKIYHKQRVFPMFCSCFLKLIKMGRKWRWLYKVMLQLKLNTVNKEMNVQI
ncbi:hypothetical protein BH747_04010 [Enterococcus villorum]|uniref:Uncharacterized protein n=1 Tax=Enterococcus villorum TaxID=112904 RepID=A0A1V8YQU7_9ENTE|nr:hypothetical protein BH747_04010 [Enterococcus villorum]OQO75005.1 hypothetical protein BH744_06400 [Enterococcus villorum]